MAEDRIVQRAHAKINLFLRVLAREQDDYHSIETLFCLIDLADEVEVVRREGREVTLEVEGADTGPIKDNLVYRAAELVLAATGYPFGVSVTLTKRIPVRAGLGGGSSDAARALCAVNHLARDAVPFPELLQFATRLGSDVPFFMSEARLALGWGHGERLVCLPALPSRAGLLLVPQIRVETAEAYRWVDSAREGAGRRRAVAMQLGTLASWSDVARMAGNDFESPVFGRHATLRQAFESLAATNPLMCRMSGSGSACYAIYRSARDREDAQMMLGRSVGATIPFETLA